MLTCYDYPSAVAQQEAGIEVVLVGDSLGTNVLGYASEREVTLADIAHHVRAVRRGLTDAYLLADLPDGTYETPEAALANARSLLADGADGVKLEGPRCAVIAHLVEHGVDVCGHLGLEPQHHLTKAVQGKTAGAAQAIIADAERVAAAGAFMLVLELIPEELGAIVTRRVPIPTIGIGAGRWTDGQVLVVNDMLGITPKSFRHNRRYQDFRRLFRDAAERYRLEVESGDFPSADNVSHMAAAELESLGVLLDA